VESAQHNDQEYHLEEGDEYVTGGEVEAENAENRREGTLADGQAQGEHAVPHPVICGHVSSRHEMVGDVSGKVDGEANAHNEIYHGY